MYGSDPNNTQNAYTLESDPKDPDKNYVIKLILVLKNISGQQIYTKSGFSNVELLRALKITDPCGNPLELPPDAENLALDAPMPRFKGGRALVPAEILGANFVRSLTIDDLRQWFPVMYELPGEYKIAAQLKGARFFVTEVDSRGVLQAVANHRSNWFGIIEAKVGLDAKPQLSILILPVSGGRLKIRLEKEDGQTTQPLFGVPVKAIAGSITEDPANVWEATDIEPVLTGTSGISGEVKWECNKCLPQGTYTILAKQQDKYQTLEVTESNSGWGEKCSGLIEQTVAFVEEPPVVEKIIKVSGSAYNYPEGGRYLASYSMDVSTAGSSPAGLLRYSYTKTRMIFASTEITEVSISDENSASIKGKGTVNRVGNYTFEAFVFDGSPDQFGITIKTPQGDIYYSAEPMNISGGNLQITIE